jgi:hypothetical protein
VLRDLLGAVLRDLLATLERLARCLLRLLLHLVGDWS